MSSELIDTLEAWADNDASVDHHARANSLYEAASRLKSDADTITRLQAERIDWLKASYQLNTQLAEARDKALEEAADACEAHMKQFLDDNDVRKMWPATQARNDVYAGIIRALKSRKGTGDE